MPSTHMEVRSREISWVYIDSYEFPMCWREVFDLLFEELPKLEDCRFAKLEQDDYEQTNGVVLYLNEMKEGLYSERYLKYGQGHMVYHDAANAAHKSSLQRDTVALARLPTKSPAQAQEVDQQETTQVKNTQEPATDEELNERNSMTTLMTQRLITWNIIRRQSRTL